MFNNAWLWIIVGVMIMGLEIVIPGVYLIWIGMGGIVAGIALALLPDLSLAWQFLIFAAAMLASLGLGFFVQRRSGAATAENGALNREREAMVGMRYVALSDFRLGRGRIRVGDTSYAARGADDIRDGMTVEVVAIENGDLVVRKAAPPPSTD